MHDSASLLAPRPSSSEEMLTKKRVFSLILLIVLGMLTFVVGEILIRLLRPQYTFRGLRDALGRYYAPSECNPFALQANYRGTEPSQEFPGQTVEVSTNSLGLRGREITQDELRTSSRILVLGDSYTFGVYVHDNETYCSVLESSLSQTGRSSLVLNAGYADGYETDEQVPAGCW